MDYLEEWKANNDLFKWHEDLKQKRFSYFLSIQTAFMALYGLVLKEGIIKNSLPMLLFLLIIAFAALAIVLLYGHMDNRARAYVDTVKSKLLLIESDWLSKKPKKAFSTYLEQFEILVHRNNDTIRQYLEIRRLGSKDSFSKNVKSKPAHLGEKKLFLVFRVLWLVLIAIAIGVIIFKLRDQG